METEGSEKYGDHGGDVCLFCETDTGGGRGGCHDDIWFGQCCSSSGNTFRFKIEKYSEGVKYVEIKVAIECEFVFLPSSVRNMSQPCGRGSDRKVGDTIVRLAASFNGTAFKPHKM